MAGKREKKQQVGSGTNNSSFTNDLFGPKDPTPSTLFGSVFDQSYSTRKQDFGGHYNDNAKHGISGNNTHRGKGENSGSSSKDNSKSSKNNNYDSQTVEPSYLSSSVYYGAQEVYPPTAQTYASQSAFKKDGRDDDPNGADNASRGNWWQGSLYY